MIVEKQNDLLHFPFDPKLDENDWERLIRCMDKKHITEIVKRDKHLQQREFRGFRPDHLPWNRVPKDIALHAQTCDLTRNSLLHFWLTNNSALRIKVKEEISLESIEDSIAKLLASIGYSEMYRDQLLLALKFDEREEIRDALAKGLQEALLDKTSYFFTKVEQYMQATALDRAKKEFDDLKRENSQLKIQNEQIASLQDSLQTLSVERNVHSQALQKVQNERDMLQQERDTVCQQRDHFSNELESEKLRTQELQQNLFDLRRSLDTIIASQLETSNEVKRRLHDAMQQLAEEREEASALRQNVTKLQVGLESAERERSIAYQKRDAERTRADNLETFLRKEEVAKQKVIAEVRKAHIELADAKADQNKLRDDITLKERDHSVLLKAKQELEAELKQSQIDLTEAFQLLEEKEQELLHTFDISRIDEVWDTSVTSIAQHFALHLPEHRATATTSNIQTQEKLSDWQKWLHLEEELLQPLLSQQGAISVDKLQSAVQAQKLLTLRWYLVEWIKFSILEALRANNQINISLGGENQ